MTFVSIAFIKFYQFFISPYKGFCCAHRTLHKRESCSNQAKILISQRGFVKALPLIRTRFMACREAYEYLQSMKGNSPKVDLSCDLPCDFDVGECGGGRLSGSSSLGGIGYCDPLFYVFDFSKRTSRVIISIVLVCLLVFSYVFYGRDINAVYITDLGVQNQRFLKRMTQRENPQIRVLLISNNEKVYSQIVKLDHVGDEYRLMLNKPLSSFIIDTLQVLDARVNVGNERIVVGQVLEQFKKPLKSDQGVRFRYRIKRRWHF